MTIHEYIDQLEQDPSISTFIEGDRDAEITYVRSSLSRFERIARSVPNSDAPLRILDIGTTPFTLYLKQTHPHYEVSTLDRTDLMAARCEQVGVTLKSCNLDDAILPFDDESFDVVIFTEVLEHIFAPPSDILREVKRIMRPSGKLILGVPNIARLSERIRLLLGRSPLPAADHQMNKDWQHGHGHIHEYTRNEILGLCRGVDLQPTSVSMLAVNPLDMIRGRMKFHWKQFLYYSIVSLFPSFRGCIHVECCK
ncbi:MAG TPA: methyltransferase domain-containing protein [Thermoguttaceae bacterium]|nr:methyltransferase domain-containing protein [Thermoguttaceae bacterium]